MSAAFHPARSTDSTGRMYALDGLRGTMMLLGLVFHGACSYMTVSLGKVWPYQDAAQSTFADFLVSFLHSFRMPIFFVLAGLFAAMLYAKRGSFGLLENRVQRIGIPLVVALLVLFPITNFAFIFANVAKTASVPEAWAAVWATAMTADVYLPKFTMHLWFLYYLMYFYVAAVAIVLACKRLPATWQNKAAAAFRALLAQPVLRVLVPAALTALTLVPMRGYLVTATAFLPDFYVMLAYGVFFGFGWLLYAHRDALPAFTRFAWLQLIGALVLYVVIKYAIAPVFGADQYTGGALVLWSVTGGVVAWMMFFGTTGLFLRYFDKPSAVMRYVVDGSYWVYLVHLPFLMFVVGFLSAAEISGGIKLAIVIGSTAVFGFLTYDLFVRSTFLGRILNGQKYPRALTVTPPLPGTVPHAG